MGEGHLLPIQPLLTHGNRWGNGDPEVGSQRAFVLNPAPAPLGGGCTSTLRDLGCGFFYELQQTQSRSLSSWDEEPLRSIGEGGHGRGFAPAMDTRLRGCLWCPLNRGKWKPDALTGGMDGRALRAVGRTPGPDDARELTQRAPGPCGGGGLRHLTSASGALLVSPFQAKASGSPKNIHFERGSCGMRSLDRNESQDCGVKITITNKF